MKELIKKETCVLLDEQSNIHFTLDFVGNPNIDATLSVKHISDDTWELHLDMAGHSESNLISFAQEAIIGFYKGFEDYRPRIYICLEDFIPNLEAKKDYKELPLIKITYANNGLVLISNYLELEKSFQD